MAGDDDAAVNEAIYNSLKTAKENNYFLETRNPVERKRKNGVPVGLKNVGNSKQKKSYAFSLRNFNK